MVPILAKEVWTHLPPIYRKALFTTSGDEESSGKEEKWVKALRDTNLKAKVRTLPSPKDAAIVNKKGHAMSLYMDLVLLPWKQQGADNDSLQNIVGRFLPSPEAPPFCSIT